MTTHMQFEARANYLYVLVTGSFELSSAQACSREFLRAGADQGHHHFLVDTRSLRGTLTASERFAYSDFVANEVNRLVAAGRLRPPRLAYVGVAPITDPMRYGLTVIHNRGIDANVLEDYDEAVRWLAEAPADS